MDESNTSAPPFTDLHDLVTNTNGGRILFATDEWFAEAENLIKPEEPVWKEAVFTPYGKWMDGWETRRKRIPGHDWCIIQMGFPGIIKGLDVDTAFFTGNYAPRFSLQAAHLDEDDKFLLLKREHNIGGEASPEEIKSVDKMHSEDWCEIVPMTPLKAGYPATRHNYITVTDTKKWTHLRLNIFPDGGIARFKVFGIVCPNLNQLGMRTINLFDMRNGARCLEYSNAHYGHPRNLTRPGSSVCMSDGWETARQKQRPPIICLKDSNGIEKILDLPGSEWAIFKFGCVGIISSIEVDTSHFSGNSPYSLSIEGYCDSELKNSSQKDWKCVLAPQKLTPNYMHNFQKDILNRGPFNYIKILIVPDGGLSRIKVWGTVCTFLEK